MVLAMSKPRQPLHVLSVDTESGDHLGPFLFEKRPTDDRLEAFLRRQIGEDEFAEGPGWRGTFLHLSWSLQPVHAV